jgi:hypothetical protein
MYALDRSTKPWTWIRISEGEGPEPIGGCAVMININEVYNCGYSDVYTMDEDDESLTPEAKARYEKICETGEEVIDPRDIIITGRELHECRHCGSVLGCVDVVEKHSLPEPERYDMWAEYQEHRMCLMCVDKIRGSTTEKFGDEHRMQCYTNRCPFIFMEEVVSSDMSPEISAEIVKNGIMNMNWSRGEMPIPNDGFIDERIKRLIKQEPKKLRHMAAYVLMRNPCLKHRYSDSGCNKINHDAVNRWFLTLRQEDYQERMMLGTYDERLTIGG